MATLHAVVQHSWWLHVLDVWSGRPLGTSNLGYNRGFIHFPGTKIPVEGLFIYLFVYLLLIKMSQRYPHPGGPLLARANLMHTPHLGLVPHISTPRCRIRACMKEKGNCYHFAFSIDVFFLPRAATARDLYQNIPFHQSLQLNTPPQKSLSFCATISCLKWSQASPGWVRSFMVSQEVE